MENQSTAEVSQPITVGGGETPVSWDQLESVSNYKETVAKNEAKEEIKAKSEAKKELGSKESKPSKEEELKAYRDSKESKSKEPGKESKAAAKESDKSDGDKDNPVGKRLRLHSGEESYELPLDIKVPVKVDGKMEEVSLQEALSRYSQQKHLDKLYQDYKQKSSSFEKEQAKIKQTMANLTDLLTNKKDVRGFIEAVAEPLGLDPNTVYSDLVGKLEAQAEEAFLLSPEEKKARQVEQELSYYKRKMEAQKTEAQEAQTRQQLESSVEQLLTQNQMQKADFVKGYDDLIKLGFNAESITPEQIGIYHKNLKTIERVETKLAEKNPELAQDTALIEKLATYAIQTNATAEEIDLAIEELYSTEAEKKLAKKVNKSLSKAAKETPMRNPGKDPMFFDDI